MDEPIACSVCQCAELNPAHTILALLAADDVDAALAHGLLDALPCPACSSHCNAQLATAREARQIALAARDRHRARDARLHRRKAERDSARVPKPSTVQAPALPTAVAEVLARALAKARTPR